MDNWQWGIAVIAMIIVVCRYFDKRLETIERQLDEILDDTTLLVEKLKPEYDDVIHEWIHPKGNIVNRFADKSPSVD